MRNVKTILTIILVLFTSAVYVSAQKDKKNQKAPLTIRVNIDVKDAAGNRITDLTNEQVKIFENGVEQTVTYFLRKGPILNLGLVMDNTGSMRPRLKDITNAGYSFVDMLSGRGEAFVVRFVSSDKIEILQNRTHNKVDLNEALDNLFVEGGQSAVVDAIYLSAQQVREREKVDSAGKYVLVVMSDMEDRESHYALNDVRKILKGSDAQIFVINFLSDLPKKSLARAEHLAHNMALDTGGRAYILRKNYTPDELAAALKNISEEIRYPYVIGYSPANQMRDGTERKITVQVADSTKGEKRAATLRESVFIPKE